MPRLLPRLLIITLVLGVVLVVADRAAAAAATKTLATSLQQDAKLASTPTVRLGGSPFLTQALRGRYTSVEATMTKVPAGEGLVLDQLDATLTGVHASIGTLAGGAGPLTADKGQAEALISFAALGTAAAEALDRRGITATFGYAGADRLAVDATVSSLLGSMEISGEARITVRDGAIAIAILPDTLTGVPSLIRSQLNGELEVITIRPDLPMGFRTEQLTVTRDGLQVRATATAFTISG